MAAQKQMTDGLYIAPLTDGVYVDMCLKSSIRYESIDFDMLAFLKSGRHQ